jgi:hypothetical protein
MREMSNPAQHRAAESGRVTDTASRNIDWIFNQIGVGLESRKGENMLWTIFVVLGILWLLGFSLHIGGGLIHLLLVVALVVLVINLLSGRRGLA